tara:strand:+ start:47 stop:1135 length:1089 start_codon:yes stop_codon:yes gene_type:complete
MDLSLFDYQLPKELIAQEPSEKRAESRLMVYNRASGAIEHTQFKNIIHYLPNNSQLFRNKVSVLKARLFGTRKTGGTVECILLNPAENPETWWCLIKPGKKTFNARYFYDTDNFEAEVLLNNNEGRYKVRFKLLKDASVIDLANRLGKMPLPPYIERVQHDPRDALDSERYQTVYADSKKTLAAAAPTAGLHFTHELIDALENKGHTFHDLTLNVGVGTFQPIKVDRIEDHKIHSESYEISAKTIRALGDPKKGIRIAVGTTSVRTIESIMAKFSLEGLSIGEDEQVISAQTNIYIYPPADFKAVDALITNFHLPKSSLLCLVSAFLEPRGVEGIKILKELYNEAIKNKYKFYSYGDALLIL